MRLMTLTPEAQLRVAVAVPLAALALSLLVVWPAWGRYQTLSKEVAKNQAQLLALQNSPLSPPGPVAPAADDLSTEPPQFLGQVTAIATEAGCQVVGFDITPTSTTAVAGPVRPVRSKIDVEGSYPQVRDFLARLTEAPRLYVVSDLVLTNSTAAPSSPGAVTPTGRTVHATVEIERYVTPPAPAASGQPLT